MLASSSFPQTVDLGPVAVQRQNNFRRSNVTRGLNTSSNKLFSSSSKQRNNGNSRPPLPPPRNQSRGNDAAKAKALGDATNTGKENADAAVPPVLDGIFGPQGSLSARQVKGRFWGAVSLTCRRLGQIGAHHTEGDMVKRICYRQLLVKGRAMVFGHSSPAAAAFLAVPPSQTPAQPMDHDSNPRTVRPGSHNAARPQKQQLPTYSDHLQKTSGGGHAHVRSVTAAFGGTAPTNCHHTPVAADEQHVVKQLASDQHSGGLGHLPPLPQSAGAAALCYELRSGRRPSPCTSELLSGKRVLGDIEELVDSDGLQIQIVAPDNDDLVVVGDCGGSVTSDDDNLSDAGSADSGISSSSAHSDASMSSYESCSSDGSYTTDDSIPVLAVDEGGERKKSKPWFKRGARKIRARLFGKTKPSSKSQSGTAA